MDITRRFPVVRLLIKAKNMMITLSCHNFTILVDLDFGCTIARFKTIVTAPIGRNLLSDILTVELETFMVNGSIECGAVVFFIVVNFCKKNVFLILKTSKK